jgi:hypothetical protein
MGSIMPRVSQTWRKLWHCSAFQFSDTTPSHHRVFANLADNQIP